jgi:hypothetical protein
MDFRDAGGAADALSDFAESFLPPFLVVALHGGGESEGLGDGIDTPVNGGFGVRVVRHGAWRLLSSVYTQSCLVKVRRGDFL